MKTKAPKRHVRVGTKRGGTLEEAEELYGHPRSCEATQVIMTSQCYEELWVMIGLLGCVRALGIPACRSCTFHGL